MYLVGKIDIEIYNCITKDITTDEVIITDKQIDHIKNRHPNDYELFNKYLEKIVEHLIILLKLINLLPPLF